MINIGDVETGVLVSAITATGRWLATAARAPRGRKAEDLSIARWFETYKLTEDAPTDLPGSVSAEHVADVLSGPDIQATLQELLCARLTNAPDNDATRAREAFCLTLTLALPSASPFASSLIDFYDDQICALVARLQASDPALLTQIRSEALSARMIAVLNAIERHTAALTNAPRDADTWLANYRRQAVDHHGKLQPPDFDRRRRVPLADIYVPATIYEEHSSERIMASPQPPPSLTVWDLGSRADRTVLLGDPGGGKTTASNVLVHHFASNESGRVPFLVTLRDFASSTPERSVVGWIEHQLETFYQCPPPPGLVDMLLLTGRAIVFFDGLDELLDTSRRSDVATRVERFCTEYPLAPVLVTSRVVGYDQARLDDTQFTCYRLDGFRDEDVRDYARKWFALDSNACSGAADAFMSESGSVRDLRSNPLLLSLMCILYRGEGSLPRNRAEIYQRCADLLFRTWDAHRRIHQDLRAGHLVEPTLRHLAWWLFTREETQSAVTERELVNTATEFLHGRGFESADEARNAAQEFIDFCRGRMWVFSDTGTTATGEPLYSFTHRTFLEYFTAAQLAFDSDTPEKLARKLLPHIAKGEWEVVGELAVQIKDSTSTDGARRVYEILLSDRRRRTTEGRSNILQFLARGLRSVDPSPQAARRLTREAIGFLFSDEDNREAHIVPLSLALCNCDLYREIVVEAISSAISEMIESDSLTTRINGIHLAITLGEVANEVTSDPGVLEFWYHRSADEIDTNSDAIISAAYTDKLARYTALDYHLISVKQAILISGGLQGLLEETDISTGTYMYTPTFISWLWDAKVGTREPDTLDEDFGMVGDYLIQQPGLPWAHGPIASWDSYPWKRRFEPAAQSSEISQKAYLGSAAILAISVEFNNSIPSNVLDDDPSLLGLFSDIYRYIESRKTGEIYPQQLPDLPVPDEFKQVFRDWAAGKVNFVGDSPDDSA